MTYAEVDMGYVSKPDLQRMKKNAYAITTGFLQLNRGDIFAVVYDAFDKNVDYRKFNHKDPMQADLVEIPHKSIMAKILMESANDLGVSKILDMPILDVKRPFTSGPKFLPDFLEGLRSATASVDILSGYAQELGVLRKPIVNAAIENGILAHIPGSDRDVLTGPAMDVDYDKAEEEMNALVEKLMGKREETFTIHTRTGFASDSMRELVIECPGDSNEVSARPDRTAPPSTKKRWANVPTLELFRYAVTEIKGPYAKTKADGGIVIDLYVDGIGRPPHPLVLEFENGIVVNYYFVNPHGFKPLQKISHDGYEFLGRLHEFFDQDVNARTFAEDADGFNEKARISYRGKPVRTVEAEKVKWANIKGKQRRVSHIAVGDNFNFGGLVKSGVHKDMLYAAEERFAEKDGEEIPIVE
jgi:hypothetical protein